MADHDHRATEAAERLDQRLARLDVEMVGRLIEDQNMRRISRDQRKRQPRPLAARELAHFDIRLVPGKSEPAELRADRALWRRREQALHMLERRLVGDQFLDLMLREITDAQFAGRGDPTRLRPQLAREQARQCRLAIAVAADQGKTVVGIDAQIQPRQHRRPGDVADGNSPRARSEGA